MQLKCRPVATAQEMTSCRDIRRTVFVGEQGVPESREQDGMDEASRHFAAFLEDKMVATCRVRFIGSTAKIERVAVLKDFRSKGIGRILMKYILQELSPAGNIQLFKLSSQADAVPFYEKFGFKKRGNEYIDAGLPHYDMVLEK